VWAGEFYRTPYRKFEKLEILRQIKVSRSSLKKKKKSWSLEISRGSQYGTGEDRFPVLTTP
jgi:hypothetical protein